MKIKDQPKTDVSETSATKESQLNELKNLSRKDEEIKSSWRNTATIRNRNASIADYYEQYPVLKLQIGIELVNKILFDHNRVIIKIIK